MRPPLLAALVLLPLAARAQSIGPHPLVLRLPASARARAMGNAYVAVPDNDAIFYNPALLGAASARGMSASAERYGAASTLGTLSMAMALAPGGLGIGVQMLDYGAECAACVAGTGGSEAALATRGGVAASSLAASVGFGVRVKGLYAGLGAKYAEQRVGSARGGAGAVDVGLAIDEGPFFLALAAQNLGGRVELAGARPPLPRRVGLGLAAVPVALGMIDLSAALAVVHERGHGVRPGLGLEVSYVPLEGYSFTGRAGARRPGRGMSPLSLGAAVGADRVMVEYAFQPLDGDGDVHRVGLRVR